MSLHERVANANPKLSRGLVWCRKCGRCESVNAAECLSSGWPKCCSQTMTVDAPEESGAAAFRATQEHGEEK